MEISRGAGGSPGGGEIPASGTVDRLEQHQKNQLLLHCNGLHQSESG